VEFKTALDTLKIFERRVSTLEEETNRISKAKLALDLDDNSKETIKPILNTIAQEILDLKSVWIELSASWKAVDELKETLWSAVVPRKVRRALEDIIARLKQLPNRIRQYQAFHHVQKQIKGFFHIIFFAFSADEFLSSN
jgi:dynein heavy chain 1